MTLCLLPKFSHASLIARYREIDILRSEIWPIAIREKILWIRTLEEKISRMSNMSTSADYEIRWREYARLELSKDILTSYIPHIFAWFGQLWYRSGNLLLSAISDGEYSIHSRIFHCFSFCFFYGIAAIRAEQCTVSDKTEFDIFGIWLIYQSQYSPSEEVKQIWNLYFWSLANIVIWECPEADIGNLSLETRIDDLFDIVIAAFVSFELWQSVCSSPATIAIHDESYMLEHIVYKKVPREYQYQTEKQCKKSRFAFWEKVDRICLVELCFLLRVP